MIYQIEDIALIFLTSKGKTFDVHWSHNIIVHTQHLYKNEKSPG